MTECRPGCAKTIPFRRLWYSSTNKKGADRTHTAGLGAEGGLGNAVCRRSWDRVQIASRAGGHRRLLFARALARQGDKRLPKRLMFAGKLEGAKDSGHDQSANHRKKSLKTS